MDCKSRDAPRVESGLAGPSPQARAEELGDLIKGLQGINSDTKEIKQLSQETRRHCFGTNGIFLHITTCVKGQQNFASAMPKIVQTEHDDLKQDMYRLGVKLDLLAEAHGERQGMMRQVVTVLETQANMLETQAKKGAQDPAPPLNTGDKASPKAEAGAKDDGLRVPDYVPSVPPQSTPATVSLSQALAPPRHQQGPDIYATMAMCMDMLRAMQQHHANARQ
eukprot:s6610_g4.t1